jgi:hypothetical protein
MAMERSRGLPRGRMRKETRWEEGTWEAESAASRSGLETSGDGTQRKAARNAGSAVSAGIVAARDEERLVSCEVGSSEAKWETRQQRGGSGLVASDRTDSQKPAPEHYRRNKYPMRRGMHLHLLCRCASFVGAWTKMVATCFLNARMFASYMEGFATGTHQSSVGTGYFS